MTWNLLPDYLQDTNMEYQIFRLALNSCLFALLWNIQCIRGYAKCVLVTSTNQEPLLMRKPTVTKQNKNKTKSGFMIETDHLISTTVSQQTKGKSAVTDSRQVMVQNMLQQYLLQYVCENSDCKKYYCMTHSHILYSW